jgi:hypothetical protein
MADLPALRHELSALLDQVGALCTRGVFTAAEHEQLRAVLLAALQRTEQTPAAADEILDAVEIDASPYDLDVLDAVEWFGAAEAILDAVAVAGKVDDPDVLDPIELPEEDEEVLDAVDLGDADDTGALDAHPIEDAGSVIVDALPLDSPHDRALLADLDLTGFGEDLEVLEILPDDLPS